AEAGRRDPTAGNRAGSVRRRVPLTGQITYAAARNNPRNPSPGGRGTSRSPDKRSASGIPRPQATQHAAGCPPDAACGLIRATPPREATLASPLPEGEDIT